MKSFSLLSVLVLSSFLSMAQPLKSADVRADRETQWMKDSLNVTPAQGDKVHKISLDFNQKMDKAATSKSRTKLQKQLMTKKDASLKKVLTKTQYAKYYAREKYIRQIEKQQENSTGPQPY